MVWPQRPLLSFGVDWISGHAKEETGLFVRVRRQIKKRRTRSAAVHTSETKTNEYNKRSAPFFLHNMAFADHVLSLPDGIGRAVVTSEAFAAG